MSDASGSAEKGFLAFTAFLNFPGLYPQAVMYALFDEDPRPSVSKLVGQLLGALSAEAQRSPRAFHLHAAWNRLFDEVHASRVELIVPMATPTLVIDPQTGQKVFQVTSSGVYVSSDRSGSPLKRWLVSRSCMYENHPVVWCIPIEVTPGSPQRILLTKENAIELEAAF